jgi:glycosyltransferase involved in cell wall biosynthesis
MPKVIQYHPSIIGSDAIGYSVRALHELLKEGGWESELYCGDANIAKADDLKPVSSILDQGVANAVHQNDLLIVHFSFYDDVLLRLASLPIKKILVYHNITPGVFFRREGMEGLAQLCDHARIQLSQVSTLFDLAIGDSEFNSAELRGAGFPNVRTIPVFVNTEFFSSMDSDEAMAIDVRESARTNIVFVGRFVPNKGIGNTIQVVKQYARLFDSSVKLHLVGKVWDRKYYELLIARASQSGVAHLIQTHVGLGALKLKTLLGVADAFVSMSEHEGFMVPLIEAFAAGCPVIANDAGAVRETMGEGGFVLDQPDPALAAGLVRTIKMDAELRERIIQGQARRAFDFRPEKTLRLWLDALRDGALAYS